jgi:hypothetical protein
MESFLNKKLTLAEAPFCSLRDWINFSTFNQEDSRLSGEWTFVYKSGCKSLERTTQRRHETKQGHFRLICINDSKINSKRGTIEFKWINVDAGDSIAQH